MATRIYALGGPSGLPLAMLAQAIPMLSRHELESLTERLIDRLDEIDGDPDLEDDDPAGQMDEDEINTGQAIVYRHGIAYPGSGCLLSDDDCVELGPTPIYGEDQTQPPLPYRGHHA
ncbi:hypothetical protein [Novosphingobium olei]|uniref:Uncharacterized protein n=1 Tax=Novosphingobium olei TaxID=2728851 RepID=A0A7Y0BRU9_9SPHN|nr:hypothetical protein [Novosphingobium olei]NML95457.1 hypothetical protein [Novosphingobium olei]